MRRREGFTIIEIVVAITIIAVVCVAGYWWLQGHAKPTSIESFSKKVTALKPSPMPTIDPSHTWVEYTNSDDKYNVKYPSDLVAEPKASLGVKNWTYWEILKNPSNGDAGGHEVIFCVSDVASEKDIQKAIEDGHSCIGSYKTDNIDFLPVQVDGLNALSHTAGLSADVYQIQLIRDGRLYDFAVYLGENEQDEEDKAMLKQMLSTLKFL